MQSEVVFTQKTRFFVCRIFRNGIKFFLSSIGISDGGNWLVIVNVRFPKKDKKLPASIGKSDEGYENVFIIFL